MEPVVLTLILNEEEKKKMQEDHSSLPTEFRLIFKLSEMAFPMVQWNIMSHPLQGWLFLEHNPVILPLAQIQTRLRNQI